MIDVNEDELKKKLTPEQYHILREKGTEAPFSGKLLNEKHTGDFVCAVCGQVVFKSDTKFESGTGWPSFYDAANNDAIVLSDDDSFGMHRTEVTCSNCGSHLGHLFHDAPEQPTGERFCINSASLDFEAKK
ncbi:MAG: pilin-like transcription factor [Candidatus Saccharibacteria bacterium]|nr:pilin-like transcription factor [Candidatus Saccharibacteria bacterium]